MTLKEDVEKFLKEFKYKMDFFDIVFIDRLKNRKTILELGITVNEQKSIIKSIALEDFSEGPIKAAVKEWGELWVFGKDISGHDVYIKISLGSPNHSTICVSFHISEFPIKYPFKPNNSH